MSKAQYIKELEVAIYQQRLYLKRSKSEAERYGHQLNLNELEHLLEIAHA